MFFDPVYLVFMLPGLILSMLASFFVKSTFAKYSQVTTMSGFTGAQAAYQMLLSAGVTNVRIERVRGFLSDHYDPSSRTLRLSSEVYGSTSISAIGVACHEAGHALQHSQGYVWLGLRSFMVPAASFGSRFSYIILVLGFCLQVSGLIYLGCILFGLSVLFSIITLPVEWNASARAKAVMGHSGFLAPNELSHASTVLNAAFMTYVAGAVSAIMTLLYYLYRAGLIGGGSRRR